ncbi:phenylacetic acid degradation protein PaaN [Nonomuraea sp. NPDC003201]
MFEQHRETLEKALSAIAERGYWSAYPESPSPRVYGEGAAERGKEAFESYLGKPFPLDQPGTGSWIGAERSPYGIDLGVTYPEPLVDDLIAAARAALPAWRDAGPEARALACVEIVDRINRRSFELASAVQHTTGQAFVMAFQAGGPHAQDRALEAVAYGYAAMTSSAASARWEKPAKGEPLVMDKRFTVVPRGVALVIGCNTFPTWNAYPGLFASLVTGNPVIVKPHPRAVLPLAITVRIAREVLAEAGFDPGLVSLAVEEGQGLARTLATHPDVRIVDFTGSTEFGDWLERNARQALVHTEKAGVNTIVVDSTGSWRGMLGNLAFSLSLYSGQMCTAPQNLLVPAGGIETDEGHKSFDEVCAGLAGAVGRLLGDDARAVELTGAIVNPDVLARVEAAPVAGRGGAGVARGEASGVPGRGGADAGDREGLAGRLRRLRAGAFRADRVRHPDGVDAGEPGGAAPHDQGPRGAHGRRLLHLRRGARPGRTGRPRRGGEPVVQPDGRGLRQPVGGVQRLPRHGRQPGRHGLAHGPGLRRGPLPHRPDQAPGVTWGGVGRGAVGGGRGSGGC